MHGLARWVVLLLAAAVSGCQSAPRSAPAAKQAAPPDLSSYGITTVAILDMANTTDVDYAGERMAGFLESQLKAGGGYNYFTVYETAGRANRDAAARADYERLRKDWNDTRRLDPALLVRFGSEIGAQGVLAAELLDWTIHKVDQNVEGKSYSRVTCKLTFFETRTGMAVWTKTEDALVESANYDPTQSAFGDQGAGPSGEAVNRAPDPPAIDDTAQKAAERLARALPKPKPSS